MPNEKDKILEYLDDHKSLRGPAIYYCDIESLIKKIDMCDNNPKQSFTTKINKHEACGFSVVKKSQLADIREKKYWS